MNKIQKSLICGFLALLMLLQISDPLVAYAADEVDKALNPAKRIEVTVPESLQDGGTYFFIREDTFSVGEKSGEKLYIPIQRTGSAEEAADVTLKLIDMSARFGVNYEAELYQDPTPPVTVLDGIAIIDLFLNADEQIEYEPLSEEELGELLVENGGSADLLGPDGEVVGSVSATPLDENGEATPAAPAGDDADGAAAPDADTQAAAPNDTKTADDTETAEPGSAQALLADRSAFLGVVSDRQHLEGGEDFPRREIAESVAAAEAAQTDESIAEESYPGREFPVHFAEGETVKFLVVTPKYSAASDGDSTVTLMLKGLPAGASVPEGFNLRSVVIQDEDEREIPVISMAEATVYASKGLATVTVTRSGDINNLTGVMLSSADGSAAAGDDYSGVGAKLWFSMGMTTRTVEIPVGHGTTAKDFTLTISPLPGGPDVQIGQASTRVVIPAVEQVEDAVGLMAGDAYGEAWNLRSSYKRGTDKVRFLSDYSLDMWTHDDKLETQYAVLYTGKSYAWDGIHMEYNFHTWYGKGIVKVEKTEGSPDSWHSIWNKDWGDCSGVYNQSLDAYYGQIRSPWLISIDDRTWEVHNGFRDSYTWLEVNSVQPIRRSFTVELLPANELAFEGMTSDEVHKYYTNTQLNSSDDTTCSLMTGDNFSVSRVGLQEYARLKELVAVADDGRTYRLGTADGASGTIAAELSPAVIDALAARDFIRWTQNGSSYSGKIRVRPVYDYVKNVTVQIADTPYGSLCLSRTPELLWDFNADCGMNAYLGATANHNVSWTAELDGQGNNYYTFTATGDDPYVSVASTAPDASRLAWVKVRVRNAGGADAIELYGRFNGSGPAGNSCVHIDLAQDPEWRTYVVNIPTENIRTANTYKGASLTETVWKGKVDWLRIDPIFTAKSGDSIQIDYVAFFATETEAKEYRNETASGKTLGAGTHTFHYGDKLVFIPNVSPTWASKMWATGVSYSSRRGGSAGVLTGEGIEKFTENGWTITLDQDWYSFEQVFTDVDNMVTVRVPNADLPYFDTTAGLFKGLTSAGTSDGYQIYTVAKSVLVNDFVELTAIPKDYSVSSEEIDDGDEYDAPGEGDQVSITREGALVPVWTIPGSGNTYSGNSFCFFAGTDAAANMVTLRIDRAADSHAWYSLRGTAYYSTLNLTTGNDADDMFPASGAILTSAGSGVQADEDGSFTLEPMMLLGGSWVRYASTYNGTLNIREVKLPAANAPKVSADQISATGAFVQVQAVPVSLGNVKMEGWSRLGAHFDTVKVQLGGFNPNKITAVEMNGKTLTVDVHVDPGQSYTYNGRQYTEQIKDVTLWFQSQITGEIHGSYSINLREGESTPGLTWDPYSNTARLSIRKFDPTAPEKYTWGDVIMVQLTTDKKIAGSAGDMVYQPVSTGYAVITDQEYVPQTYDDSMDMASMIGATLSEDEGNTRYSFGKFPWLGEITGAFATFSYFVSSGYSGVAQEILDDLELMDDDEAQLMDGGMLSRRGAISAAIAFKETPYGGVRTMIAVALSMGNSTYSNQANPYRAKGELAAYMNSTGAVGGGMAQGIELIQNQGAGNANQLNQQYVKSQLGGSYIYFTIYVGLYCDWGFIEVAKTDGSGETEISHEALFLGAGGFYGIKLTGGFTKYAFPFGIPVYFNIEANVNFTVYLGASANPNKTLQSFYETEDHKGQDFAFNIEIYAEAGLKLTIGIGLYKIIGVRASGGVGIQAGMSLRMKEWYPGLEKTDSISYSTDATFSGTIDLLFTSIDLWSASWPLPLGDGWMQYFQQMRRANALIHFINEAKSGSGLQACRQRAIELGNYVDAYTGPADALREKIDDLNDFAYDTDVISLTQWRRVNMIRQGGIVGNMMDTFMLTDDEEPSALFHTRDHVSSTWVAGQNASLQAAFGPVSTSVIEENSVSQPAAQIAPIGGNQFLVVFLGDEASRPRQQANALKWTIYNATTDTWTAPPQILQDDGTADGRANLVDGGDKLILSWTSVPQAKYAALKSQIADELRAKNGSEPAEELIQAALERDPARMMDLTEIFTVEFSKSAQTFGAITQLTDDSYYDEGPQAVYDSETGDYIVLYYKTGRDTEYEGDAEDRLLEMTSSNPGTFINSRGEEVPKTYTVLAYMLYNNQTQAADTRGVTHAPGWAWDYYFANETDASLEQQAATLASLRGQRFFNSVLRGENGEQLDPPIADLAVCNGYNGLATFAFTVDRDYNVDTDADKELYVKFYDFARHLTYVAVKVAGEAVKGGYTGAVRDASHKTVTPAVTYETLTPVDVGQPRLIRNEGSTWLFWREDNEGLRYLNISEMLNDRVGSGPNEEDWTYALQADGTFATDYASGRKYTPKVQTVDFGSVTGDGKLTATDYLVITDRDDNLYVVWTDVGTYETTDPEFGGTVIEQEQPIYASARIREEDRSSDAAKDDAEETYTAAWSKPFALTRDHSSNDGVAVALDDAGGLVLLHNQYRMEFADTEAEIDEMLSRNLAGIWTDEESGKSYFLGYPYYPTAMSLAVTRCEAVGSVEATRFSFDDDTPAAGQTVTVTAIIENTGLTGAKGCDISFYEYKNGVQGKLLHTVSSDEVFQVNTARRVTFPWTVPADGPEGCSIQAVAKEKKTDGTYYDPVETFSDTFSCAAEYELELVKCVQNGDSFDAEFTVTNTGNLAAPQGARAELILEGLYGDLKEKYGMDDELLITEDVSGLAPGAVRTVTKTITLPVSVFRFCGYDAVTVVVKDAAGEPLACTDHNFITLDAPMNVRLGDGEALTLSVGETKNTELSYESTVFMDVSGRTLYTVDDPSVAYVDESGAVTGLSSGSTTVTATMLPSGASAQMNVVVLMADDPAQPEPTAPSGTQIAVEVSGDEGSVAVNASVSGNTAFVTAPTEAQLDAITGGSRETGFATVDLSRLPENVSAVSIPAETVKAINAAMEDGGVGLTVKLPNATVTFDVAALAAVAGELSGPDLKLNVDPIQSGALNAAQRQALAELDVEAIYDIYLTSGSKRINDFGSGYVSITVGYEPGANKLPGVVVAWHLPEGGGKEKLPTSAAADTATFTVRHFSIYALTCDMSQPSACDRGDDCPMSAFSDLNKSLWYHDGVHWALENGIMDGVGDGVFKPNTNTSRAMLVTMLWRMEGKPASGYAMTFADVPAGTWYTEAVRWAAEHGIVDGYSADSFKPNNALTREQLAAILCRYAKYKGIETVTGETTPLSGFDDVRDVSDWAIKSVRWAVSVGIINGTAERTLSPRSNASRAQVATMLMRYVTDVAAAD